MRVDGQRTFKYTGGMCLDSCSAASTLDKPRTDDPCPSVLRVTNVLKDHLFHRLEAVV